MPAQAQDFSLFAGDSMTLSFTIVDSDGTSPLDLTGAAVVWQMRSHQGVAPTALIEKDLADGIAIQGLATAGVVLVTLDPADSEAIGEGRYPHAMVVTDAGGNVSTVEIGFCDLSMKALVV